MDRGVDLLALALLMATLRDWLVICQRRVPVVCHLVSLRLSYRYQLFWGKSTCSPGVSMPAVTTRFDITKHDMRKGRKTGLPVSVFVPISFHALQRG